MIPSYEYTHSVYKMKFLPKSSFFQSLKSQSLRVCGCRVYLHWLSVWRWGHCFRQRDLFIQCFLLYIHCVKSVQIWSNFWFLFSRIRTEYGEMRSISSYSVQMWENTDKRLQTLRSFKKLT